MNEYALFVSKWCAISDEQFHDGIEPSTFEAAVEHVMRSCFGYNKAISLIVQHEYTNWSQQDDPVELRRQYINVRLLGTILIGQRYYTSVQRIIRTTVIMFCQNVRVAKSATVIVADYG